ncbi:hypothetical protein P1P75_40470 [Streptomyces sp. ID05-39B]|uniref:hypothetical protein n=1 Tax=Streptomyces sp. ID05-39B TaxID=3028664 RepID=UPI0029AD0984|nr:hypothetical protein [Streptomyces sp. ID05-39B]MDX3532507.1 hypothetical protein [Streptomyces sp. ID05-39B]
MTDQTPEPLRIPIAYSVVYAVRGLAPIPNMYGAHELVPGEITLTYRASEDSQLGRIHAYVAGHLVADGVKLPTPNGLYGQHYDNGLEGWPAWLAEEARLHDPAAVPVPPPADQTAIHQRIAAALAARFTADGDLSQGMRVIDPNDEDDPNPARWVRPGEAADAVMAVLPEQTDRAAVLLEAADDLATAFGDPMAKHIGLLGAAHLRRRARSAQTSEAQPETPMEKRLRYSERRNDELRAECKRRGKNVLEQSLKIVALERQIDEVRSQLGAEILRAGQAETELRRVAAEEQPAETGDALAQARATNQRLNLRTQRLESELATYRRAVAQWEVSDHRTYVPMRSLAAIAKAAGRDIETPHWLLHYQRVEQAEAAIERVRALREPIAEAIERADYSGNMRRGDLADSVMPVIHAALDATARPAVGEQPTTCTATIPAVINSAPDRCVAPAGHYDESNEPVFTGDVRSPGGWHTNGQGHVWSDRAAAATPHNAQPETREAP